MPVVFDKERNSARKYQKKKDGTPVPESYKAPVPHPEPPAGEMRVRILRDIRSRQHGTFTAGQIAKVDRVTARSWIGFGLAEEDKALDGPSERK